MTATLYFGPDNEKTVDLPIKQVYTDNMDEIIECPHCRKKIRYGDGYSSHRYYFGESSTFAMFECEECYFERGKEEPHE